MKSNETQNIDMKSLIDISQPWLQYAIRKNFLHESEDELFEIKQLALLDPKIKKYLEDIEKYHSILVTNHKNPDLPIHKLLFLFDIGFDVSVPEIQHAINQIMEHKDQNGVYQSLLNIPAHFGGSGENTFGWSLCDAPLLLLALLKGGVNYEEEIKQGTDYLVSLFCENGFPCAVSQELGKFRGPGRKSHCCPYATLVMLKLLIEIPAYKNNIIINQLAENILTLWENSRDIHPYMFYMGTDFRKVKAPTIWYDILNVTDVLSKIEGMSDDKRFLEMLTIIRQKEKVEGLIVPESIYLKCRGWDFGQKKSGSPYITYLCMRIMERLKNSNVTA